MRIKILRTVSLFILLTIYPIHLFSQEENHHNHHHHTELGIANSMVLLGHEQEWAYGLHLHLIRNIGHSNFGLGLGYERIFDDHGHNSIGIVGSYSPVDGLHLNLAPGLAFEDGEFSEAKPALHIETSYGFRIGNSHIGPLWELAFDSQRYHMSFGLHIGLAL